MPHPSRRRLVQATRFSFSFSTSAAICAFTSACFAFVSSLSFCALASCSAAACAEGRRVC